MSDNDKRSNIWSEAAGQVSDHLELATLEMRYEVRQAKRRAMAMGAILVLLLTGFILLQVTLILSLMQAGWSAWLASLVLGGAYLLAALLVYWFMGRRDKRAGTPFEATQRELKETLRWIQNIFS